MTVLMDILKVAMGLWTAVCIFYHLLVLLLSAGTTDFNGNPYTAGDYIAISLLPVSIGLQLWALPRLIKQTSMQTVGILIGAACLPWLANVIVYGSGIDTFLVPAIYAVPLLLLWGGYQIGLRSVSAKRPPAASS